MHDGGPVRMLQFFDIVGAIDDATKNVDDIQDSQDDGKKTTKDISDDIDSERGRQRGRIKKNVRDTNDRFKVVAKVYLDILTDTQESNQIGLENQEIALASLDDLVLVVKQVEELVAKSVVIKQEVEEDLAACLCEDEGTEPSVPPGTTTEKTLTTTAAEPPKAVVLGMRRLQNDINADENNDLEKALDDLNSALDDLEDSIDDNNDRLKDNKKASSKDRKESKKIDKKTKDNKSELKGLDKDADINQEEILKLKEVMLVNEKIALQY